MFSVPFKQTTCIRNFVWVFFWGNPRLRPRLCMFVCEWHVMCILGLFYNTSYCVDTFPTFMMITCCPTANLGKFQYPGKRQLCVRDGLKVGETRGKKECPVTIVIIQERENKCSIPWVSKAFFLWVPISVSSLQVVRDVFRSKNKKVLHGFA